MRLLFVKIKKLGELIYLSGIVPFWWLILLLAILVAAFSMFGEGSEGVQIGPDNLTANSGFEILSQGKPASWKEDKKGGWKVSEEEPYEGERAMQAAVAWRFLSQEIKVEGEKSYILRAQVKSDITITGKEDYDNTFLTVECLNWRKKVITKDYGIVDAIASWQKKTQHIYTPRGTRKIRIRVAKRQGEGSVWFDDIKLIQVSPSLVANGSFEVLEKGKPAFWKGGEKGFWKVSEQEPYGGDRCMETIQSWNWLWQDVPVRPRKWYILEAQVRSDITFRVRQIRRDYENTFLSMQCLDKDGRVIRTEWGNTMAFPLWHKRQTSVYTPEGVTKIRVKLAKRVGQGRVWFDDVRLIRSSSLEHFSPKKLDKTFRFTMYGLVAVSFSGSSLRRALKSKSRQDT